MDQIVNSQHLPTCQAADQAAFEECDGCMVAATLTGESYGNRRVSCEAAVAKTTITSFCS
jgi:hypothetical protein